MNLPDGKPILELHSWCPGCDETSVELASHYACKAVLAHMSKAEGVVKAVKEFGQSEKCRCDNCWQDALGKALAEYEEFGKLNEMYL